MSPVRGRSPTLLSSSLPEAQSTSSPCKIKGLRPVFGIKAHQTARSALAGVVAWSTSAEAARCLARCCPVLFPIARRRPTAYILTISLFHRRGRLALTRRPPPRALAPVRTRPAPLLTTRVSHADAPPAPGPAGPVRSAERHRPAADLVAAAGPRRAGLRGQPR